MIKNRFPILFFLFTLILTSNIEAQIFLEPDVIEDKQSQTPFEKGARNGMGLDLILSDFGFSLGGQYRQLYSNETEFTLGFAIGSLRDATEQTFVTAFSEIIPNKYNRILSLPLTLGVKKRLFSQSIRNNFRLHVHSGIGVNPAYVYPYFVDSNQNQVRDQGEFIQDALSGLGDGTFEMGYVGELMIGIDFGNSRKNFTTVRFGLSTNYFPQGIQVMEPFEVQGLDLIPLDNKQNWFLTPQFNLVFGGFW